MTQNSYTGKPELTILEDIANDGFFPALKMADLVTGYRIPSEYDNNVIKDGLMTAMIDVNQQLASFKALIIVNHATLASYCVAHSQQIGGVEVLVKKYQEAVFCYAKALLLQQFKTMNRKETAENLAKEAPDIEKDWKIRSYDAVIFMLNKVGISENPSSRVAPHVVLI